MKTLVVGTFLSINDVYLEGVNTTLIKDET